MPAFGKIGKTLLLLVSFCLYAAAQRFEITPSEVPGLALVGADSPEFNQLISTELPNPEDSARLKSILPFSVIVVNRSSRAVKGVNVRYDIENGDHPSNSGTLGLTDVSPWLPPGGAAVVTPSGFLRTLRRRGGLDYEAVLRRQPNMTVASAIRVSLDFVLFDGGEYAGPDRSGELAFLREQAEHYDRFIAEAAAKVIAGEAALLSWLEDVTREKPVAVSRKMLAIRANLAQVVRGALLSQGMQAAIQQVEQLKLAPRLFDTRVLRAGK